MNDCLLPNQSFEVQSIFVIYTVYPYAIKIACSKINYYFLMIHFYLLIIIVMYYTIAKAMKRVEAESTLNTIL